MALDPKYVLGPSLQMYFVNKDTGLPLSGGLVYFYIDGSSIPKSVYEISGVPPNFQYSPLTNPVVLSSVGTFQDGSGNDILPYYYPFDSNGNIELYTIQVFDSNGVLQFTREGFPNVTASSVPASQDVTNYIPNSQFLLHNNSSSSAPLSGTQIHTNIAYGGTIGTLSAYQIAQGGWTFEKNSGSTSVDAVTFQRFSAYTTSPTGNPRYAVQIATTASGSDTAKDLCVKFNDVNTFASGTQQFNLYFEAKSVSSSFDCQILIRKYFGSGTASASIETVVSSISLTTSFTKFNTALLFGTNEAYTIGPNDDDYVEIVIRLPPTGVQTAQFTDFALILDANPLTVFPPETEAQQTDASTAGWLPTPNPDGSNLYLPIVLAQEGFVFDNSMVGKIYGSSYASPNTGELLCDGSTYQTSGYSTAGIPYSRLQAKLFNGIIPIYGTGSSFVTAIQSTGITNDLLFTTNIAGAATAPANSSSSPGFTFTKINTPSTAGYGVTCYQYASNSFYVRSTIVGSVTAPTAGTSPFTVTDTRNLSSISTAHIFSVVTVAAAGIVAGQYFTFTAKNPGNINYYVWFTINGAGADPTPGGTGIEVDLLSTMSAQDVAIAILNALNGGQQYLIACAAASAITAGHYFTFGTHNSNSYYVWYQISGAGSDPAPSGLTLGIKVAILSGDTNAQVATKTQNAINSTYFAVPDLRGMFLRGTDPNSTWNYSASTRFGMASTVYGAIGGTFEFDQFLSHNHTGNVVVTGGQIAGGDNSTIYFQTQSAASSKSFSFTTDSTGQTETNPVDSSVYWMIKY